ncbi:MAG: succinylglutamate desuccinylase/aspartoacylase family protein [Pseudomonadales bacterium]|nr:succinylglutamate desuccinylase/aspartoacylase family protein [Pseudomonadales bacterium]
MVFVALAGFAFPSIANEDIGDDSRSYSDPRESATEMPVAHDVAPLFVGGDTVPEVAVTIEPGKPPKPDLDGKAALKVSDAALPGKAIALLNDLVPPGEMRTLDWSPQNIFEGIPVPTPVLVANGAHAGPVLCMTGAIHGDEINSIETIRRVMHGINPQQLAGTVVGVPIVNQMGFRRSSRYLPDRRDLNRYFPGSIDGSSASRIAYSLFNSVIRHCDALIDLHTGSFYRTNIPQLRADLKQASVRILVEHFGDIVVLHSEGSPGMLRREATLAKVPTVTLEAGEALRIQEGAIKAGVKHINRLLENMNMTRRGFKWTKPQPAYMASRWLRAQTGGIFISQRKAGDKIAKGDKLGTITDPITNSESVIYAKFDGKIIGMAMNQVVLPGYAVYHVGIDASRAGLELNEKNIVKEVVVEESVEAVAEPGDAADAQSTAIPQHRSARETAAIVDMVLRHGGVEVDNEAE